jgi:hypothetical protein
LEPGLELKIHALFWVIIAFLGREAPQKTYNLYPEQAEFKFQPRLFGFGFREFL